MQKSEENLFQRRLNDQDLLRNISTVDAVIRIAKEPTSEHQVMTWTLKTCVLVIPVKHLLSDDGKKHAYANAKRDGNTRICEFVPLHDQLPCLGVITNAMSFGIMSAAARVLYSFSFSVMPALVGTLAFSTAAAVSLSN